MNPVCGLVIKVATILRKRCVLYCMSHDCGCSVLYKLVMTDFFVNMRSQSYPSVNMATVSDSLISFKDSVVGRLEDQEFLILKD